MEFKHNKANVPLAKTLRKNMTPEEKHLWYDFLKEFGVYNGDDSLSLSEIFNQSRAFRKRNNNIGYQFLTKGADFSALFSLIFSQN